MTETRQFEGRTEEEAVSEACAALGVEVEALDYTVLDEGSDGVLGLGKRPVQIRVRVPGQDAAEDETPSSAGDVDSSADASIDEEAKSGIVGPAPEKAAAAKEVAEGLATRMGISCKVSVRDDEREIVVLIEEGEEGRTDVADTLGKSRPPAIPSFQFLLNKIVNRFPDDRKHIVVEVPSVPRRERRPDEGRGRGASDGDDDLDPTLVDLARMLAERSLELKKVITVHPMAAGDRRAVHKTVMGIDGVQTVSEGEGLYRRMHIVPDALRDGAKKKRRRRRRRRPDGEEVPSGSSEVAEDLEADETDEE